MPQTILRFKTDTPDAEWTARQRERKNTADVAHDNPDIEQLKHMLLRYGGWAANIDPDDPNLPKIIARGVIRAGRGSTFRKAKPVNCHCNAAALWLDGVARIGTGYALSRDGLWRQHSWGLRDQQVIETTVRRLAYFGFMLDDQEADDFAKHNPPHGLSSRVP